MLIFALLSSIKSSLHLRECRLIHLGVPAADDRCGNSGGILRHLRLPRVLALTVQLVAAQNGALDGGCGELDALALGGEVRRGDTELDLVEPEIAVFAVCLLCAEANGDRIAAGSKAVVKIGNDKLDGVVSDVTPLSKNGVISFTVQLEEDNHRRLRSGLKTDVYVMNAIKDDVLRISNASFYVGKGEYELFVVNGDQLIKRKVQLGDSNFEYVEVVGGLEPGDEVVVSDMTSFKEKNKLKLK